jgi:hypothetical protein
MDHRVSCGIEGSITPHEMMIISTVKCFCQRGGGKIVIGDRCRIKSRLPGEISRLSNGLGFKIRTTETNDKQKKKGADHNRV